MQCRSQFLCHHEEAYIGMFLYANNAKSVSSSSIKTIVTSDTYFVVIAIAIFFSNIQVIFTTDSIWLRKARPLSPRS